MLAEILLGVLLAGAAVVACALDYRRKDRNR